MSWQQNFDLSDDILAVIPTNPYEQLDLARKITSMAISSRVSNLDSDIIRLKKEINEKDNTIIELQDKVSLLQNAAIEADSRLKLVLDENTKLVQERDSLSATVKKLSRDVGKLETFKRQLMQSLNEDTPSEDVDIGTYDQSLPRAPSERAVKQTGQRVSLTPYQITRFNPTATPKVNSTTGSLKSYSAVGSPLKKSGTTTPTMPLYDGPTSLSAWYPSSQQSSATNSPPRTRPLPNRTPRVEGKEFFRMARSRLSYQQFSAFLVNIKQLNDQKQSREETLKKADEILGTENKDLYLSFQGLLSRNAQY